MRSKCISQHTVVGLEGGEFLLHPEADVIMEWFKENHPNYTLLSNCLNPPKVIDAVRNIHDTEEIFDFVALYEEWQNGNLKLRCQSIFSELVIHSNGDVPLCQNLDVKLGNIHTHSLDDIFNSRFAHKEQCRYSKECNACWINFHRKYDLILLRNLERFLPKKLIQVVYGKYQWTNNVNETYREYINRINS